jgi:flavin-dependent dehydrogenase
MGDYPPTAEQEWLTFAESLPVSAVHDLIRTARPLSRITSYRFPAYQRRLYEDMRNFPKGFLVIGDALCHFNPIYGQGMSVAALEAEALEESLPKGLDDLASRFYRRAKRSSISPGSSPRARTFAFHKSKESARTASAS